MMEKVSRRRAIRLMALAPLAVPVWMSRAPTVRGQTRSTEVERWIEQAFPQKRAPDGSLVLGRFADPTYFLMKPIEWKPNSGQERFEGVRVPAGFVTDLASIPQVFWSSLRPDGRYAYAAIVHDYLYWSQIRSRQESDTILKLGMEDFSIKASTVTTIYEAVKTFGARSWSENEKLRRAGEKRILKRFPEDPRTSWAEWKKTSANFE